MDTVREQPVPHLVCRQEIGLKNAVDWKLVRGDVKGLHCNKIIKPSCPVSTLNEALLHVVTNRVPKRMTVARTGNQPWFYDQCVVTHRAKQRAYRVWSCSRIQHDWEGYTVACRRAQHMYVEAERAFNERRRALFTSAPSLRKWWATAKTAVFGTNLGCHAWQTEEEGWCVH